MQKWRIREAEERDLDQMAAIEAVSIPGGWTGADFAEALANRQALLLLLTEEESGDPSEEKSRMRGATREADREGQTVLAYLVCYFAADEGEIVSIACRPRARRQGLATELMAAFRKRASELGLSKIFLEVRRSNRAARKFYEKTGFVPVGRRPDFYRNPREDALLLRLTIAEQKESTC